MGIMRSLLERRSAFTVNQELPDDHWFFRLGGRASSAGVVVSETAALNTMVVVACVRILAETLASLPLPVYQRLEPRGRDVARFHSLYRVLHDEPNPRMSSFTWRERVMAHLALRGNHYSLIERQRGDVVALWPVHPRYVTPYIDDAGTLRYRVQSGNTGVTREYAARDVLHVPGLAMDGLVGLSPLAQMRQAIGIAVAAEDFSGRFFANDMTPSGVLKHPAQLTDVARGNLRSSWEELHGQGRGGLAILEEGMDFTPLSIPPEDGQMLETRRFQVQEFARYFRIPPHLLADVERSTSWGSGIEQQNIAFVVYTMRPWLVRVEQEINRKLIPEDERERYYAEFNVEGLLRGDLATRKEFYATGRQWGYLSANDIRDLENKNPIEGGDVYLQPLNMIDATRQDAVLPAERAANPAERRSRHAAEERSAAARRRLANAHRAVYRDVAARIIRIEQADVRAAVRRHLRERSVESFAQWVRDYYWEKIPTRIEDYWSGPVRTLVEAIAAEAADELGGDVPPADELDAFAAGYVEVLAKRHAGDSRARLLALVNEDEAERAAARDADALADAVEDELDAWDERPDTIATDEAHRSSNAAAVFAYGWLGVLALRWRTAGSDPCDYCQAMNGRKVSTGASFLPAGEELSPGGILPFISRTSIGHPPLHTGCECIIMPG